MKPAEQEIIEHYKAGVEKGTGKCLVCDRELKGSWTDYNGQIKCHICGVTYQILGSHLKEEFLEKIGLKKKDVAQQYCDCFSSIPIYKDYWNETGKKLPIGSFMGDAPWSKEDYESFWRWLARNAEKYRAEYEDEINWKILLERFGAESVATV